MQIRRLEETDLQQIAEIRNKYIHLLRQPKPLNMQDQLEWFKSTKDCYWSIFKDYEYQPSVWFDRTITKHELVGTVGITGLDLINKKAELSLITDDYLIKEYADFAMDYIEEYAFNKLGLHKLYITVFEFDNKKYRYFNDRYEFLESIPEDVYYQGKYWNHDYFYLLEDEWRNK